MKVLSSLCLFLVLSLTSLFGQSAALPRVFILGEDEKIYEQLNQQYSQTLLEATNNDIEKAFDHWLEMMRAIDEYADQIKVDIRGVRTWLHVFWAPDGTIDHIGYLLRSDSRNIDPVEFKAFLSGFMRQYRFPVQSTKPYSHYTGATFPTFAERANN